MLSHLMSQAHPVKLFLGFSSIKPPQLLFPLSLQDTSPSPSYNHSFPPPSTPAHSLPGHHVSYMQRYWKIQREGSTDCPRPIRPVRFFYCQSDNILATQYHTLLLKWQIQRKGVGNNLRWRKGGGGTQVITYLRVIPVAEK